MRNSKLSDPSKAADDPADAEVRSNGPRRALTLDQIIEAAGVVFAEQGIANASLQDVADHLGVSRAALYYHVKSREHLLRLVIGTYISLHRQSLSDLRERVDLTPEQRLREAMRTLTRPFASQPHVSRIFLFGETDMPEDVREEQRRSRRVIQREMELILLDGQRDGSFKGIDPVVVSFAIFGMVNWMQVWYRPGGRLRAEEVADGFTDLILGGIRRPLDEGGPPNPSVSINRIRDMLDGLEQQISTPRQQRPPRRRKVS